jgi:hypothetical protein
MGHKFKFDVDEQQESQPQNNRGHCAVYGCPRKGQIYTTVWNCRYHFGKSGASLAQITLTLRNHAKEIDWYEHLLAATPVDFLVEDIAKKAPSILEVLPNENFKNYRIRVESHIENLLMPKSRLLEVAP